MGRITIVGLGLIGGSLGLALKRAKIAGLEIVGHDRDLTVASKAKRHGAVDKTEWNLISAVNKAQMVIIATPVMAIKEVMEQIGQALPQDCIVTDTGSTKGKILQWAEEYLPSTVSFVGGHPMAGKETAGIAAADANLFTGCTYCLIPARNAAPEAVKTVVGLVEGVGAKPFFCDAVEHDSFVAGVSHLPILLSSALVSAVSKSPSWREMSKLAATGFRDVSRLASGDPDMNRDICLTNQAGLIHWLDRFIDELAEYRRLIGEGGDELGKTFAGVWEMRERWLHGGGSLAEERTFPDIPKMSEQMASMFVGDRLARRSRELMERQEKKEKERRR